MIKSEINKNNKIIGDFMYPDSTKSIDKDGNLEINSETTDRMFIYMERYDLLKYHSSWDQLMPVIRKCYRSDSPKIKWSAGDRPWIVIDDKSFYNDSIEIAYQDVLTFIKWYLKQIK